MCWKREKEGHYKSDCKSKAPDKGKGSDDSPSIEVKTTSNEGGDVYLASSSTHVDHEAWLIDSCVKDSGHHISPQWYDIVHSGPKPSWICSWALPPKGLIPMEIFVHPYIPMILPTSNQCGTLFVYPTILPSNKGPLSLPSNDYLSARFSPLYQPGFSAPMRWKHTPYMVAPPVSRACSNPRSTPLHRVGTRTRP